MTAHFRNALVMQSMLLEYRIDQVLGAGGFGITYRARDTNLDKDVAIKEYLPGELAMRAPDGNVVPQATSHEAGYKWGLDRFLLEARTLAKFSHPNIVRVLRYLDGLAAVHAMGFLHRDIKPDNIFIRADGRPVLIDFGAARQAMGGETKSLTSILTPGYAPLEQYSGEGKQGPWTDLYAMGGVLYRAVADKNPPDAVSRIRGDSLGAGLATARGKYSEPFLRAIEWAVNLDEKKRPQSVEQWKPAVLAERRSVATAAVQPTVERRVARPVAVEKPRRSRWPLIVAVVLLAVAAGGLWRKQRTRPPEPVQAVPAAPRIPSTPAIQQTAPEAPADTAVPDNLQRFRQAAAAEFRSADTNNDGFLSPEEMRGRFPYMAKEFARVDSNGDGRVSLEELFQAKRAMSEQRFAK